MSKYISDVLIFGDEGEKRHLRLTKGLNIITGLSKKGKSALIEIVDYCLCAKVPSIPKGIISSFAELFCIVLRVPHGYLVIARPYDEGASTQIYVTVEKDRKFLRGLKKGYFNDLTLKKIKGAGQQEIEKHLGLNVADYRDNEFERNRGKASLRNMTPFLYQYQNLVASKHALFSKLDDFQKRKSIVEQIPIFLGIVDSEYYSIKRQIDEIERQVKAIDRNKQKDLDFNRQYEHRLLGVLKSYYATIGLEFEAEENLQGLLNLANNLPDYQVGVEYKTDRTRRYNMLREKQSDLSIKLSSVNTEISNITSVSQNASTAAAMLTTIEHKSSNILPQELSCPICGSETESLNEETQILNNALTSLKAEVNSMATFSRFDSEHLESLKTERRELQKTLASINIEITELEKFNDKIKEYGDRRDALGYLRVKIDVITEQINNRIKVTDYGEVDLMQELQRLRGELGKYQFRKEFDQCQSKLNEWVNNLVMELDFEEEFLPTDINLDLSELTMVNRSEKYGEVSLSDLGSGANWLAFHLAASLAMQRLFLSKEKSSVPNFLFLDQPSQVYFPRDFDDTKDDIRKVENIYYQILEFIKDSKRQSGIYSQVIVLDHADNLGLKKYKYSRYVRANWHSETGALI